MPLPNTIAWRLVRWVSIAWCIIMAFGTSIGSNWAVFDRKSLLHVLLDVASEDEAFESNNKKEIRLIQIVLFGSMAVAAVAVVTALVTSYAIVIEKRWSAIVFAVINCLLFVAAFVIGGMSFMAKNHATHLTREMLRHGQKSYTDLNFPDREKLDAAAKWRFVVDEIQIRGKCCGLDGYKDYKKVFPEIRGRNLTACICEDDNRSQCLLQHLPLSCCESQKESALNPFCAAIQDKEYRTVSATCNSTKNLADKTGKHWKKGCRNPIDDMRHIMHLLWHGIVNVLIGFLACVLTTMLSVLAGKTATRKKCIESEIQAAFNVDQQKASKMLAEAKEGSDSIRSFRDSRRSISGRDLSGRGDGGPQRVSSDRLEPRGDSVRQSDARHRVPSEASRSSTAASRRPTRLPPMRASAAGSRKK